MSGPSKHLRWFSLCILVACLLVQMPARTIGLILPDSLQLEGFSGSFWRGQAARSRVVIGDKAFHLGHLSWRLSPHTLMFLSPSFDLHTRWGAQTVDMQLQLTPSAVRLSNVDTKLDVRFVRQLMPLYTGGVLLVDLDYLEVAAGRAPEIAGVILWEQAVWTARGRDVGLGNYQIAFAAPLGADAETAVGEVTTASGALIAEGRVSFSPSQYDVNVSLSGPALDNQALRDALQLMAVPTDRGLRIEISGEL